MITSYHTHTTWSDGLATPAELIAAAQGAGVDELGISDHYVLTPDHEREYWAMPLEVFDDYVADIRQHIANAGDYPVRLGMEADYFPETIAELTPMLARHPFDYVIGSIHIIDGFHVDEDAERWAILSEEVRNEKWRLYWVRMREMAATGLFDIAGHLDIPKKYGFRATAYLSAEIDAVLDAIAAAGMSMEINTAGWDKPVHEVYPSLDLLRKARKRNIPIVITADAHTADGLTRHFDRARALAREAGYTEQVRYSQRERKSIGL